MPSLWILSGICLCTAVGLVKRCHYRGPLWFDAFALALALGWAAAPPQAKSVRIIASGISWRESIFVRLQTLGLLMILGSHWIGSCQLYLLGLYQLCALPRT